MNRYFGVALLFSICFFLGSSFAQDNLSEVKKYIKDIDAKMENAMIKGDLSGMNDYYADDAVSLPSYGPMLSGKAKIIQKAKDDKAKGVKFNSVKFNPQDVYGTDNLCYEIGTYDISMVMPEMPKPVTDQGKYLTIWKKMDGGKWKVVAEMWNTNKPWMEMEGKNEKMPVMKEKK